MRSRAFFRRRSAKIAAAAILAAMPRFAFAASLTGGSLPWDTPLTTLMNDISGPVAYAISVIAIVATGATLIWGGEMTGFTRTMVYVILVISLIVGAVNTLAALHVGGAVI